MAENKTQQTDVPVEDFLATLTERRRTEAEELIAMLREITGEEPRMWGPSIIGFGYHRYKLASGREGDMVAVGFSPRKASITIYVPEGFDRHGDLLDKIGKHKSSVSCLYINKLADADEDILRELLTRTYQHHAQPQPEDAKPANVDEYIETIPKQALPKFDELRALVRETLPEAQEDYTYGMVGYRTVPKKRARVFISGWKDHVAMYPVLKDEGLEQELAPFQRGKGTLWFPLDQALPKDLLTRTVLALAEQ